MFIFLVIPANIYIFPNFSKLYFAKIIFFYMFVVQILNNFLMKPGKDIPDSDEIFSRSRLLLGDETMRRLASTKVILFGAGGVGSWAAEALIRTGIGNLDIVDHDRIDPSNINRQAEALVPTIGLPKAETLASRLREVNPKAKINAISQRYCQETAQSFSLDSYDYVLDAIDSLGDKALLILNACQSQAKLFSSMGAALKIDPSKIRTAEFWHVEGCPLAAALRHRFRRLAMASGLSTKEVPAKKFLCVYSPELIRNPDTKPSPSQDNKAPNGSLVHITAIFGLTLASLVIQDIIGVR